MFLSTNSTILLMALAAGLAFALYHLYWKNRDVLRVGRAALAYAAGVLRNDHGCVVTPEGRVYSSTPLPAPLGEQFPLCLAAEIMMTAQPPPPAPSSSAPHHDGVPLGGTEMPAPMVTAGGADGGGGTSGMDSDPHRAPSTGIISGSLPGHLSPANF